MLNSKQKDILNIIFENVMEQSHYSFLESHNKLNPKLWEGESLKSEIKTKLLKISKEFVDYLGVNVTPLDVVFVGSMANYNWSESSDIDLHIILDYEKIGDKDSIAELIKGKSKYWNESHNIKIKGIEIELNAEDVDNKRFSAGVYSLKKDKWLSKPNKKELPKEEELEKIESKVKKYTNMINKYIKDNNYEKLDTLKSQLKDKRQESLEKDGEYGVNNVVFKTLRREGTIKKMHDYLRKQYDKSLSLEQNNIMEQMQFDEISLSEQKAKEILQNISKVIDKQLPVFNENLKMNINKIMSMSLEEIKTYEFGELEEKLYNNLNKMESLVEKLEKLDDMTFEVKSSYEDRGFTYDLEGMVKKTNEMTRIIDKNFQELIRLIELSEMIKEKLSDNE